MHIKQLTLIFFFASTLLLLSSGITIPSSIATVFYGENFFFDLNEILPKAYAQQPVQVERGRHYEIDYNGGNSYTYRTGGGVPLWALNPETNQYQPTYYKEHPDGTKEFRNGYITVKQKNNIIQYYDAITGTEKRLDDEDWLLLKDGQVVQATLIDSQVITQTPTKLVLRQFYSSLESDYNIDYIVEENKFLDHEIDWKVKQAGHYQWQQKWKGIDYDVVDVSKSQGLVKHDLKQNKQKINENIPEKNSNAIRLMKDNKELLFEKTGDKFTRQDGSIGVNSELLNYELDPINKEVRFHWGSWNLQGGEQITFNHGDTYSSSNPTEDGFIASDAQNGTSCNANADLRDTTNTVTSVRKSNSANTDVCRVTYTDWSISSMPDNAIVSQTEYQYEISSTAGTPLPNCSYNDMGSVTSSSTDQQIYDEIMVTPNYYVSDDPTCKTVGVKSEILGSGANADIEAQLTTSDRFVIGLRFDNMVRISGQNLQVLPYAEEDATGLAPTLIVTYTLPPNYIVDLLSVYQSSSTTLGSGTLICGSVDLENPSSCGTALNAGTTYRFEVTVRNDGGGAGSPNVFDFDAVVAASDVLGSIPVGNILNSGCSTNTNWTESIASTDARASAGTTCSISASGGTAVYWMVVTLDTDANDGTGTFTITDGTNSDTSTTTTFTVNTAPAYVLKLLDVFQSSSTTLESGTSVCLNVNLETASSCNTALDGGTTYRFEVEVDNTGEQNGSPTIFEFRDVIAAGDVLGSIPVGNILNSGCSTNTNWVESIQSSVHARAAAGTTCAITPSTNVEYWMVITLDTDANAGTGTFFIDDTIRNDVSTTTTFTIAPEAPTGLGATTISTTRIDLSWTAPATGPTPDGYQIDRQTHTSGCTGGSFSTIVSDTGSTATTYSNTGLTSNTCYSYRVWSLVGTTASINPSNIATNTTIASAPTSLAAVGTNTTNISLSWTAPTGNGVITGYKIERQAHTSQCTGGSFSTLVSNTGSSSTTYNDNTGTANQCYSYRVSAINQGGTSAVSNTDSGATNFANAPVLDTVTAVNAQLDLSWTAPATGNAHTGYKIERRPCGGSWGILVSNTGSTTTTYSDTTVAAGTCYGYRISAINLDFTSTASNEVTQTSNDVPSAPQNLTANAVSAQINLDWDAPASDGGDAIIGYRIERQQHTSGCTGGSFSTLVSNTGNTNTEYSDLTVSGGVCYSYRVSAINDVGTGAVSNTATETANGVPDTPSLIAETISISQLELTSTAGASDGGSPQKDFSLQCEINQQGSWTTVVANSTLPLDRKYIYGGLSPGDNVTCQWRDGNIVGWSNWSNNATDIIWVDPEIVVTPTYKILGDVLNVTAQININNGIPEPTIDLIRIYEDNIITKTITINSPTPPAQQTFVFYYQFPDSSNHDYKIEAQATNLASSQTGVSGTTSKQQEYQPVYELAITESQGHVNHTKQRIDNGTTFNLKVNRDKNGETFQIECSFRTGGSLFQERTWINFSNVGYYNSTISTESETDIYYDCYNDELLLSGQSYGSGLGTVQGVLSGIEDQVGDFFGVPLGMAIVLLIGAMWTGRTAGTGIIFTLAAAGILSAMGLIVINQAIWGFAVFMGTIGLFFGTLFRSG